MASTRAAATLLLLLALAGNSSAQLSTGFYSYSCPGVYGAVKSVMQSAIAREKRMGASILRLFFHDCFVQGCDASLLLDDTPSFQGEKMANPNNGSVRGFEVIDAVKSAVEKLCPGVVSCADILALAAEISVELSGGPKWAVLLGRLDSKKADFKSAENLPSPFDNLTVLEQKFAAVGLHTVDLVALSGAHTFGRVQCQFVTGRLYNFSGTNRPDPTLNSGYRAFLAQRCPQNGSPSALNDLDPTTPNLFDNHYYTNLEVNRGFLGSDQELKSAPQAQGVTAPVVDQFATSQAAFFSSFAQSMINMGNIQPLTDPAKGEVRCDCRVANDD